MKKRRNKILAIMMALSMVSLEVPVVSVAAETTKETAFVFSNEEIVVAERTSGYEIENTTLKITESGTYKVSGSCKNGNIVVKKGTTDVVIILDGLTLTSETTAPICCNKETGVKIFVNENTINTLSDTAENANSENSDAESAVIKAKSGAVLEFDGTGTLNINGVAKNGIKGAAETTVSVDDVTLKVVAANNGIASDDKVIINSGVIDINAENEGIKSEPENSVDETTGEIVLEDTVSAGEIILNGGEVIITTKGDGVQSYNDTVVNDGLIKVNSMGDGINAKNLTINGGSFDITTNNGYTTKLSNDADSCKGLKAESTITVNNGNFILNTADDGIHTNEYVYLLGGNFDIKTGDDGAHADTSLFVGEENGDNEKLNLNVNSSYEGLEAGTVYVYSGNVNVEASDDGINAAGGSSNGTDMANGFNNISNPGGGGRPGFGSQPSQGSAGNYSINVYGGKTYVNANGDGVDSNGAINIFGGEISVLGAAKGSDNSPFDCEGQFNVTGGIVFGAGSQGMGGSPAISQSCVKSTSTYNAGKNVVVSDSQGNSLYEVELTKDVNYVIYSSPELASDESYEITATDKKGTTVTPTETPDEEVTPSVKPTRVPQERPTRTPEEVTPSAKPTRVPQERPTGTPEEEVTPSAKPTRVPQERPTGTPDEEEVTPSAKPTKVPQERPTGIPDEEVTPSAKPTRVPQERPTGIPDEEEVTPSAKPTRVPQERPTGTPEEEEVVKPTRVPQERPTGTPEEEEEVVKPTRVPQERPTGTPDEEEVVKPTRVPQERPTGTPDEEVVVKPTRTPQERPTEIPDEEEEVVKPTRTPQERPTEIPDEEEEVVKPTRTPQERPTEVPGKDEDETDKDETDEDETNEETYKTTAKITKNSGNKITIKWSKVEDADGYEIYRATSKNGSYKKVKTIKNSETTSYTNSKLKYGTTYYYVVKAYENNENSKNYLCESTVISRKVVPTTTKITSVKAKNSKVTLKWKKVSGATGYEVYRATSKNGKYTKVKTLTGASKTSYVNKNLKDGKNYSYKIRAYKKVNGKKVYGNYSTIKSVTVK